ncbi:MAG: hypothetical protein ACRD4Q_00145 [Candidatus Acidiferrales bacterium]
MQRQFAIASPRHKSILFWMLYGATLAACCGFLCGALAGCRAKAPLPSPSPSPAADHSITLSWQQSFANNAACSATQTKSCISGFDEGYVDSSGADQQLHTDTAAVCAGSTQPESCTATFNNTLPIGNVTFYVKTMYEDQAGAAGETAAATSAPVAVGADTAQNVTVKIND